MSKDPFAERWFDKLTTNGISNAGYHKEVLGSGRTIFCAA